MPVAAFTLPVDAPAGLVWRLLADSAATPQRYDATVESVRVLDAAEDSILRAVTRGGATRLERVTLDAAQQRLTLTLVDDREYSGSVTLRAEAANPSSTGHNHLRLSGRMDWQPLSGSEDADAAEALSAALQAQLLALKQAAEAQARQRDAA